MVLNGKLIGGLAWTGLVLILAVPSADIVSSQLAPKPALSMTADTDQVDTASLADPVESYVRTGKPLPSYISDAPSAEVVAAPNPKPTVKVLPPSGTMIPATQPEAPGSVPAETDVAALPAVAPEPYPASLRPKPPVVTDPTVTDPIVTADIDGDPEVGRPPAAVEPLDVNEEDLVDWDSGSLADYLERRGLIADASYDEGSTATYDEDGFFLDEGPNNGRSYRSRSRRNNDDGFFFVFPD